MDTSQVTSDQTLALASVLAGSAVGLAGVLGVGLGGAQDRKSAKILAAEERAWQRAADAYVCLLDLAERFGHYALMVKSWSSDGDQGLPPMPDLAEQARVAAMVAAFGALPVKDATDIWMGTVQQVMFAERKIGVAQSRLAKGLSNKLDLDEVWQHLEDDLRPAERGARKALGDAVAEELRIRTSTPSARSESVRSVMEPAPSGPARSSVEVATDNEDSDEDSQP